MKQWAIRLALVLLSTAFALELSGRAFYAVRKGAPFWIHPKDLKYVYYPEVKEQMRRYRPGGTNVLLLSGSVMHPGSGDVAAELEARLSDTLGRPVTVVNFAMPAHGTLDSFYKYRLVRHAHFDLVIIYHGLNELRANNVPPALWRDDYSHYSWYDQLNFYFRHERWAALPFMLPFGAERLQVALTHRVLRPNQYVPVHGPNPAWMAYGGDIKTAATFRANLERILALARQKGDPVLLSTYAYDVPESYTLEKFRHGDVPYARPLGREIELWGLPVNIKKGLQLHNRIIRALAEDNAVPVVRMSKQLSGRHAYFVDVCHLSPAGARAFVDLLVPAALPLLERR